MIACIRPTRTVKRVVAIINSCFEVNTQGSEQGVRPFVDDYRLGYKNNMLSGCCFGSSSAFCFGTEGMRSMRVACVFKSARTADGEICMRITRRRNCQNAITRCMKIDQSSLHRMECADVEHLRPMTYVCAGWKHSGGSWSSALETFQNSENWVMTFTWMKACIRETSLVQGCRKMNLRNLCWRKSVWRVVIGGARECASSGGKC